MKQLPQNFLVVNHEGVFRCSTYFEEVIGLDALLANHVPYRWIVLKNLAAHPNGIVHLAIHTHENLPIFVLEAFKGEMALTTQYRKCRKENESWISPKFFPSESTFELTCPFDFSVLPQAGIKLFLAINLYQRQLNMWASYQRQNYRAPFGNIFEDGRLCTGEAEMTTLYKLHEASGWFDNFSTLLTHLGESIWNGDTLLTSMTAPILALVRFDPESLKQLPPLDASKILECGVMANAVLAEITSSLL